MPILEESYSQYSYVIEKVGLSVQLLQNELFSFICMQEFMTIEYKTQQYHIDVNTKILSYYAIANIQILYDHPRKILYKYPFRLAQLNGSILEGQKLL